MAHKESEPSAGSTTGQLQMNIPFRRRLVYIGINSLLLLVLLEGIVRIPGLAPRPFKPRQIEPGIPFVGATKDGHESFTYLPRTTFWSLYDPYGDTRGYFGSEGKVTYRINEHGFRGPDVKIDKSPGVWRVVCLGDSFTFGEGVREEDTYPAQLERILA